MTRIWKSCLVLGVSLCAGSLWAADKVVFKVAAEPGVAWKFDQTQDSSSDNKATSGGQAQQFTNKMHQRRAGKVEVLKSTDGVPTSLKITFDESCEGTADMTGRPQQKVPFAYAGKTVTITRGADGKVTDDFEGQVDPGSANELHSMIEQEGVIFPKNPVAVGDEWPADAAGLAKLFQLQGPNDKGGMTLKLLGVKDVGGRPTAEVKVSLAMFKDQQGMKFKMISQGTALVDLQTGHAVKTDMKGTNSMTGDQNGPGPDGQPMAYHVEGEGTLVTASVSDLIGGGGVAAVVGPKPNQDPPINPLVNPLANPLASLAGKYSDGKLTVDLVEAGGAFAGTFMLGDKKFPATAQKKGAAGLTGSFEVGADKFDFTATLEGDTLTLVSGSTTYKLKKAAVNPLATPPNPLGNP